MLLRGATIPDIYTANAYAEGSSKRTFLILKKVLSLRNIAVVWITGEQAPDYIPYGKT